MPTLEEEIAAASRTLRERILGVSETREDSNISLFVYGTLMRPSGCITVLLHEHSIDRGRLCLSMPFVGSGWRHTKRGISA